MREREMREVLATVCDELDRRARRLLRDGVRKVVMPAALGAGLALGGGCDTDRPVNTGDAATDGAPARDRGPQMGDLAPVYMGPDAGLLYMGPDAGPPPADGAQPADLGVDGRLADLPMPPYMAPEAGLLYMAPDAGKVDMGPLPPYMAPPPKDAATPPEPDLGPTLLYMGPPADGGPKPPKP